MDIPGYQVRRTIGRGGMATVYLALQESLDREVVLKVMNATQTESTGFVERFLNEARIVAALRHPHIITIHDIGHAGELVYIAMEYVEGGDLKSRIGERFEPEKALEVIINIASALQYAHSRGIIHRDVKPANILFRADGTVLLSDFGIAKQIAIDTELTSTGTILGSPFYMSPEQAEGMQVDGRTDVYSLGVILYELLCGERPYQGDSAIKVIMQHIQSPIPKLPSDLREFQPLVARIMAKNRKDRVADAATLETELRAILESGGAVAGGKLIDETPPASSAAAPLRGLRARLLTKRVAALLTLLALVVGALVTFYLYTQSLQPSIVVKRPPPPATAAVGTPAPASAQANAPGPAGGEVLQQDVAKALGWLAHNSIRDGRLTQPPADNAYYYYSRLLALDPNNDAARKGFAEIAERFVVLAEAAFSRRDYGKAQVFIALGLQVDPRNEGLTALQGFIENRKKSFIDTVLDLIR